MYYNTIQVENVENRAKSIVNSFYHKEYEEMTEYVCVSFLHENKRHFKQRLHIERKNREDTSYEPYATKISNTIQAVSGTNFEGDTKRFGIQDPNTTYETPEKNLAFRDAIKLLSDKIAKNHEEARGRALLSFQEKCDKLQKDLIDISMTPDEDEDSGSAVWGCFRSIFRCCYSL